MAAPSAGMKGVKFDGDPQQLGFFLAHVLAIYKNMGETFPPRDWMRVGTLFLEGVTAHWMVTLHNGLELQNFNCFRMALRQRFEDTLADQKARDHIKTVRQGWCPVAEWPKVIKFYDLPSKNPQQHSEIAALPFLSRATRIGKVHGE